MSSADTLTGLFLDCNSDNRQHAVGFATSHGPFAEQSVAAMHMEEAHLNETNCLEVQKYSIAHLSACRACP